MMVIELSKVVVPGFAEGVLSGAMFITNHTHIRGNKFVLIK